MNQAFDRFAESYDSWYDTHKGQAVFNAELKCLQSLCDNFSGRWLEVGVGTGRFASVLGIDRGVDPSIPMLKIAAVRGIATYAGLAEAVPFPDNSFDGVLMALSLCFVTNCGQALKECDRILRPQGRLLVGMVPANSPWGRAYERKKAEGHPIYSWATFYNVYRMVWLVQNIGFDFKGAASSLFWNPEDALDHELKVETGISLSAGFVSLLFTKRSNCCNREL